MRGICGASVTLDDATSIDIFTPFPFLSSFCKGFISKSHVRLSPLRYNPSHNEAQALSRIIRGGMLSCALRWQQISSYSYICHVKWCLAEGEACLTILVSCGKTLEGDNTAADMRSDQSKVTMVPYHNIIHHIYCKPLKQWRILLWICLCKLLWYPHGSPVSPFLPLSCWFRTHSCFSCIGP